MRRLWRNLFLVLLGWVSAASAPNSGVVTAKAQGPWPPWQPGEKLVYKLLWPSGLSLGEAVIQASATGQEIHFTVAVEAELPQHNISYSFSSTATEEELCSLRFQQKINEGSQGWEESIEFDQQNRQAKRTRGSQTNTISVPECARDPLAFLYYFRGQLAAAKPMASGTFHLGANFEVRFESAGQGTETVGGRQQPVEKFRVTYTGPNAEKTFELRVMTDSARRPVLVRVPFPLAVFTAELQ